MALNARKTRLSRRAAELPRLITRKGGITMQLPPRLYRAFLKDEKAVFFGRTKYPVKKLEVGETLKVFRYNDFEFRSMRQIARILNAERADEGLPPAYVVREKDTPTLRKHIEITRTEK